MASKPASSVVPQRLGPFHVVRALPPGGMADLYLVHTPPEPAEGAPARGEPLRGEPRVLKVVQTRFRDNARVAAMLRDEALIGRMLRHRNLVRVLEAGELEGVGPYLLMAFIPGRDLVGLLRRCMEKRLPFPRDLGVHVCAEVARGLAHAHELHDEHSPLEIVHCDVSPGNVMISPSGAVTLVDFGVARANLPLHCPDRGVAGKYNYMAPEQIRNEPLDRRTDLFSLGIILYELTVGERLFRGPAEAVMHKVLEDPIPAPRQRDRGYPAELEAIVLRALQRDPDERYQSAAALLSDLQAYLARRVGTPAEAALSRLLLTAFARPELEALEALEGLESQAGKAATEPPRAEVRPAPSASPPSTSQVSAPRPLPAPDAPHPSAVMTPLSSQPSRALTAPSPVIYEESAAFVFEPALPSLPPRRPSGTSPRALTPISLSSTELLGGSRPASGQSPRPASGQSPRPASGQSPRPASTQSASSPQRLPSPSEMSVAIMPAITSSLSPPPSSSSAPRAPSGVSPPRPSSASAPRVPSAVSLPRVPVAASGSALSLPPVTSAPAAAPAPTEAARLATTARRPDPAGSLQISREFQHTLASTDTDDRARPPVLDDEDDDAQAPRRAPGLERGSRSLDPVWIATGVAALLLLAVLAYLAGQLLTRYS